MPKMNVTQFVEEQKKHLEQFEKHWLAGMIELPNQYPLELEPGDWDEQLMIFSEPDHDD